MLTINDLSKQFDQFEVLKNLNWTIEQGQVMGLIGSNGAGKSTLLRCIAGVYEYENGSILLDDLPISTQRDQLVFVADEPFYLNRFTTRDMRGFYEVFYPKFEAETYQRLLKSFHFDENKPIHLLSKGLKRQSALILALSCKPKILMLDESFDGLDPVMRLTLKRELIRLVDEEEMSVIISSHNIRELEDICDRMALLENHQIVFTQSLEELNQGYHKVQLGYKEAPDPSLFQDMDLLSISFNNKIVTVVYRGEDLMPQIQKTSPVLINPMKMSMEEIFVVEMEGRQND